MKSIKLLVVVLLAGAILTGINACQRGQDSGLSDEELVEIQTIAWLKATIAKDWVATYQFVSPGYRSGISQLEHERIMGVRQVDWLGGELIGTECEGDVCKVDIRIVFKVLRPMRSVPSFESFQTLSKTWLKQDGHWWLVQSS